VISTQIAETAVALGQVWETARFHREIPLAISWTAERALILGLPCSRARILDINQIQQKGAAYVPLAGLLWRPDPDE
jgi:hypothetical protein